MIETPPPFTTTPEVVSLLETLVDTKQLSDIQNDYLYWDKVKYKAKEVTAPLLWQAIKLHRKLNARKISFGDYSFTFVLTDFIQETLYLFDTQLSGNLSNSIDIPQMDKAKFMVSSLMEEAIASSQIEGANTTRKKAKEMIQQGKKPKDKSEQMILNNYTTMQHLVAHFHQPLSEETLLYIHKLITHKTLDNPAEEGAFRQNNEVHVVNFSNNEIVHTPPEYTEIPILIGELCAFFNTNTHPFIHPLIKACILHFMIGFVHPFVDGNGRTARALFYWYLLKEGYWLTEYLSISSMIKQSKGQYEKAYLYTEADDYDLTYFLTYQFRVLHKAYEALKQYLHTKQKEAYQAAHLLKILGVNERMAELLKLFCDEPERILTIKEVEHRFQVSNYTARTDLKALVNMGFLEVIHVNQKKQNFVRSPYFLQLLEEKNARFL
ncbi:Fic family protein [Capnocytophaga sp. oral taxon 338]|uniref:Fic family protein n=1 Tax=Capnocytophaga sp. oral taxon 338 TaxID=710239 RepID=UPI000202C5E3|nr:Fic family protein [Capnocytophaga sp. oral taxon 338]EGD34557.1 fic family protein [Capnocytophaga sp. oral taxon 338 str. F0234]